MLGMLCFQVLTVFSVAQNQNEKHPWVMCRGFLRITAEQSSDDFQFPGEELSAVFVPLVWTSCTGHSILQDDFKG